MKQLISVTELKECDDNIKTKTSKPFRLRTSKHMPKTHRYHSTDTLSTQKHHSQPTPNPYNTPSLKVHVYSHSSSSSSTLPLYLLHGPHFLPSSFFYPPTISFQHTSYICHRRKLDFSFNPLWNIVLDTFTVWIPGGPTGRSIGPLIGDKQCLERQQMAKDLLKGRKVSQGAGLPASIGFQLADRLLSSTAAVIAATFAPLCPHWVLLDGLLRSIQLVVSWAFDRHQVEFGLSWGTFNRE